MNENRKGVFIHVFTEIESPNKLLDKKQQKIIVKSFMISDLSCLIWFFLTYSFHSGTKV